MFVVLPLVPVIACTHPGTGTVNLLRTLSSGRQALLGWAHPRRNCARPDPAVLQIWCKGGRNGALKFSEPGVQKNSNNPVNNVQVLQILCVAFEAGRSPLNRYHSGPKENGPFPFI